MDEPKVESKDSEEKKKGKKDDDKGLQLAKTVEKQRETSNFETANSNLSLHLVVTLLVLKVKSNHVSETTCSFHHD